MNSSPIVINNWQKNEINDSNPLTSLPQLVPASRISVATIRDIEATIQTYSRVASKEQILCQWERKMPFNHCYQELRMAGGARRADMQIRVCKVIRQRGNSIKRKKSG
jgi:hypothetical protein